MGTWDEHVPRYWLEATVPTRDNGSSYPYHYYNSETIHAHTPRGVFSALLASFSKRHFLPDVFPGGSHPPQRWTKRHYQRSGRSPPLLNSQLKLWSLITVKCDLATTGCLCIAATSYTAYIAVGFSNSYNKHTEQNKTTKCLVYFFSCVISLFWNGVSYIPGWSWTACVANGVFERLFLLPLPPLTFWDYKCAPPHSAVLV